MRVSRFDLDHLRGLVGDKVFERGENYAIDGRVELTAADGERLFARVHGSEPYRVALAGSGRKLEAGCTCPYAADFGLCKHIVAVVLTAEVVTSEDLAPFAARVARVRSSLAARDAAALVELLVDTAMRHPDLLDELDPDGAPETDDEEDWD
jgi:uncharacterized Zn finger protein